MGNILLLFGSFCIYIQINYATSSPMFNFCLRKCKISIGNTSIVLYIQIITVVKKHRIPT